MNFELFKLYYRIDVAKTEKRKVRGRIIILILSSLTSKEQYETGVEKRPMIVR